MRLDAAGGAGYAGIERRPYRGSGSGSSIEVTAYWAMESATSGATRIFAVVSAIADGEVCTDAGYGLGENVNVPGTAKYLKVTTLTCTQSYENGDLIRLTIGRGAGNAGDTASGDMHLIAVKVAFV